MSEREKNKDVKEKSPGIKLVFRADETDKWERLKRNERWPIKTEILTPGRISLE